MFCDAEVQLLVGSRCPSLAIDTGHNDPIPVSTSGLFAAFQVFELNKLYLVVFGNPAASLEAYIGKEGETPSRGCLCHTCIVLGGYIQLQT